MAGVKVYTPPTTAVSHCAHIVSLLFFLLVGITLYQYIPKLLAESLGMGGRTNLLRSLRICV